MNPSEPAVPASPTPPARLRVGIVGAGRVGAVLGSALARAGHSVVAAAAVSDASRGRAEVLLPGAEIAPPDAVLAAADLVLLTVPDDALADLVAGLAATGAVRPGQFLAHTSGRHGLEVLAPAVRCGAHPLALHPAMTFTGTSLDLGRLTGAVFGVTAPTVLRPIAEALVVEMGGEPVWVEDEARPLYHAALAHGANHLVTLVAEAQDLLRAAGVDDPSRALAPLLGAALDNALRIGDQALTGPVARGDAGTVGAHLSAMAQAGERLGPDVAPAYRAMARATADRALADGRLRPKDAEALLVLLAEPGARP